MRPIWRLILDGPVPADENMARDRAIQLSVEQGHSRPTLRLYRWSRPTVTLGRFQDVHDVDVEYVRSVGIDVVKRFTGGRGVLHDDELTYSVIAGTDHGVPRGVAASYRYLSTALASAYERIGIAAAMTQRDAHAGSSGACYLANTRADLSLGALKLAGSAQVWHGSTVLQHGSFTISRDLERDGRVFMLSPEQMADLARSTTTILELTGERLAPDALIEPVVGAFSAVLGVDFERDVCSAEELESARSLLPQVQVQL